MASSDEFESMEHIDVIYTIEELDGAEQEQTQKNSELWNPESTKLLIEIRLEMEQQFITGEKSKNKLWRQIIDKMKAHSEHLQFSVEEARKKFGNLMVTYNRIVKRKKETGRNAVVWKYFEDFDRVYGTKHNLKPTDGLIFDASTNNDIPSTSSRSNNNQIPSISRPRKRQQEEEFSEILDYWKEEDKQEKVRFKKLLDLEKEKNDLERRKIECLNSILELLTKKMNS